MEANITFHIEGDVNIFLSGEGGEPERLFLDGVDGTRDTVEIVLGVNPDGEEENAVVLYARPGERPVPMKLYDTMKLALENGGVDSAELLPEHDLLIAFNGDDVIFCDDGGGYLTGPGIIIAVEDGDIISMDAEEQADVSVALAKSTKRITNGRDVHIAYEMWGAV